MVIRSLNLSASRVSLLLSLLKKFDEIIWDLWSNTGLFQHLYLRVSERELN